MLFWAEWNISDMWGISQHSSCTVSAFVLYVSIIQVCSLTPHLQFSLSSAVDKDPFRQRDFLRLVHTFSCCRFSQHVPLRAVGDVWGWTLPTETIRLLHLRLCFFTSWRGIDRDRTRWTLPSHNASYKSEYSVFQLRCPAASIPVLSKTKVWHMFKCCTCLCLVFLYLYL